MRPFSAGAVTYSWDCERLKSRDHCFRPTWRSAPARAAKRVLETILALRASAAPRSMSDTSSTSLTRGGRVKSGAIWVFVSGKVPSGIAGMGRVAGGKEMRREGALRGVVELDGDALLSTDTMGLAVLGLADEAWP